MVQAMWKLTNLSLATSVGSDAGVPRQGIGQLLGGVIQQFIDHVAVLHLQVPALADGFGGGDRVALDCAARARLDDFVAHAQVVT